MGHVFHEVDDRSRAMSEAYRVINERLAILEWPFEASEEGHMTGCGVSNEDVFDEAKKAGFTQMTEAKLKPMSLYIYEI